ncbi:unnamed protein product [Macrosiphum euphorbiae]|uniref:Uncharacterized protein n=1 Tax=Macrosiphum euphorbiae TaxID=13131 RepID=A0AAV0WNS7_9HEMI|nr:unnamed protein product [Macrosiphum euphorbiae]
MKWIDDDFQLMEIQLTASKMSREKLFVYIEELEKIYQAIQEGMISENCHSKYSLQTLCVSWEQLLIYINRIMNKLDNQILNEKSTDTVEKVIAFLRILAGNKVEFNNFV